jgi:phage repressor protein C with HTH and peptisase S24 domain
MEEPVGDLSGEGAARYEVGQFAKDFALVPRYRVHASAGSGSVVESEEIDGHVAFRRDYLRREGLHVRNLATLYARGDSMSPTIRDRALLLVDVSIDKAKEEGVYLLSRDDGALSVKRVQPVGNARLRVISDNPAYPPLDLHTPELSVRGLVVLVSQRP